VVALLVSTALHFAFFCFFPPSNKFELKSEPRFTVLLLQEKSVNGVASKKKDVTHKSLKHTEALKKVKKVHHLVRQKHQTIHKHQQQSISIKTDTPNIEKTSPKVVKKSRTFKEIEETNQAVKEQHSPPSKQPDGQIQYFQKKQKEEASRSASIPQHIQAQMLSYIHYPRVARRRGWEGRAELQLYISSQHIEHIEVAQSTGHDLLDKAAMHGLVSMTMITLKDGMYRLPVVFRLQ